MEIMNNTLSSLKAQTGASLVAGLLLISGCSSDGTSVIADVFDPDTDVTDPNTGAEASDDVIDIYDAVFTARSADCADYINTYDATPVDIQNSISFDSDVIITATDTECTITSNSVPNHDFNDETAAFSGGQEGATIAATTTVSTITRNPAIAETTTAITQTLKNGIFLNGVRLDILSAGCYRPNDPSAGDDGNVGIGCSTADDWLLDPLGTESKFGADLHNAHTQPGGLYHYHGGPEAMFDDNPGSEGSPVIGFAADGFPIYGSYFFDNDTGQVRKATSGYTLREGSRGTRSNTNPGGDYSGEYNDDWEFTDAGDLDVCNGMTLDGQYGYYVTDTYPWVLKCLSGTPNASFGGGEGGGPPPIM